MPQANWKRILDVNLESVFGLVQAAVVQMKKQGKHDGTPTGHVVLISSTAGQRGEAFHADYAVTKGAIISLTKSLSSELAGHGIRINCVAPGWVDTEMSAATIADPVAGTQIRASIPLRRPGTPMEIAGPVLFLCTPYAGFMNGSVVSVNGGG